MKKKIICFIGLDGSGKSTCINHAYDELKKNGVKVKIVRAAYVAVFSRWIIKLGKKILMKKNSDEYTDYKTYLENLRKQSNKGLVYKIFSFVTTVEFKLQIFFRIRLNRLFGYTLLVDRYIYDNVVTYAANLALGEDYMVATMNKKWKHSPKADLIIYVKTPTEICFSRKNDTPDILYLEIREPLYDKIAELYNAKIVYGDKELNETLKNTMDEIYNVLNCEVGENGK